MPHIYLGADVSKGYADFCLAGPDGSPLAPVRRFDDTSEGHASLRALLNEVRAARPGTPVVFGVEASGGLERNWLKAARALSSEGDLVYQLNPLVVKRYRQRHIHQNVTDATSAQDIADYLRDARRPADRPHEPALEGPRVLFRSIRNRLGRLAQVRNELQSLLPSANPELVQYCRAGMPSWLLQVLARYPAASMLAKARAATLARIPRVTDERAAALIEAAKKSVASLADPETAGAVISLVREIRSLEEAAEKARRSLLKGLENDREVQLIASSPGIGLWTAACIRLECGSLARFHSANALVAFAGLDPRNHQSGDAVVRSGISRRGRSELRATLYMAAISAIRFNPAIRDFYARLRARGKCHMVAVVACMAKLLRIAYACVLKEEEFDADAHAKAAARHEEAAPSAGGAAPTETRSPNAPVSRREAARRRRAADAPPAGRSEQERGHAAAPDHDAPTGRAPANRRPDKAEKGPPTA